MTAPLPLRTLLAKATKGSWPMTPIRSGDKWIEIEAPAIRVDYDDVCHEQAEANAVLLSRLNPAVMERVLTKLESISAAKYNNCSHQTMRDAAREALALLNGTEEIR